MSDKELWELMSIICEGQDSEQRRKVEQYITDLQKEIDRLGKLFYERNEEKIRLNNIIEEVREYIKERYNGEVLTHTFDKDNVGELLEILDKGE